MIFSSYLIVGHFVVSATVDLNIGGLIELMANACGMTRRYGSQYFILLSDTVLPSTRCVVVTFLNRVLIV